MPLNEELYCHQQICIPPTFPYLLKQYAKAAIRSQPTDLLKWSTAYFRCLALNVPPPVKPRLEYPIPRDYIGITPGWLKALNYQLQNCKTVNFKILWDRWMGACLDHNSLLQVLCLGGFNNPEKIPWNKFIGLCAGFLNDNLTQTMIMFCEIITEEPEGGSAMIPLESFLEVYKFLAIIDASQPQYLPNLYFTDEFLGLETKEKKRKRKKRKRDLEPSTESTIGTIEELTEEQEVEMSIKGESSVISCPDITSDEVLKEVEAHVADADDSSYLRGQKESTDRFTDEIITDEELLKDDLSAEKLEEESIAHEEVVEDETHTDQTKLAEEESETEHKSHDEDHDDHDDHDDIEGVAVEEAALPQSAAEFLDDKSEQVATTAEGKLPLDEEEAHPPPPQEYEEEGETAGERSGSSAEAGDFMYDELDELEKAIKAEFTKEEAKEEEALPEAEEEVKIEEVFVPAVPGIGPKVPDQLVEAVERHLKKVAALEHGMTMPRHIRHYTCPPLKVFDSPGGKK